MPPLAMPPMARVGGVVSTLMTGDATLALLPALSTAVPVTDWLPCALSVTDGEHEAVPDTTWFLPSAVRMTSAGQPPAGSMPDRSSAQLKWTVTFRLYQPLALGAAGETV